MVQRFVAVARTHVGRERRNNEDAFAVVPHQRLAVVADGMGGHAAGEVASQMAVDDVCAFVDAQQRAHSASAAPLKRAIEYANGTIFAEAQRANNNMGTTVVALCADHDGVRIAHVGDSRAYRFHAPSRELECLTLDHSVANLMRAAGHHRVAAELGPNGECLARALGLGLSVDVDLQSAPYEPNDVFLLCTDGLTGPVDDNTIGAILRRNEHARDMGAAELIDTANAYGGPDNVTVVLVRVLHRVR